MYFSRRPSATHPRATSMPSPTPNIGDSVRHVSAETHAVMEGPSASLSVKKVVSVLAGEGEVSETALERAGMGRLTALPVQCGPIHCSDHSCQQSHAWRVKHGSACGRRRPVRAIRSAPRDLTASVSLTSTSPSSFTISSNLQLLSTSPVGDYQGEEAAHERLRDDEGGTHLERFELE